MHQWFLCRPKSENGYRSQFDWQATYCYYLPPWEKLRVPLDLSLDWELVNRLPKIQTEAEFSVLMFEHFVGFPPFCGTRNYAHGGKGPFRTSYKRQTKLVSLHPKSHQNLSLLNFKCAARIIIPGGTRLHKRAGVHAGNSENDPNKIIKGTWV